ncbi:LysR family transcriptional regulator [Leifsonia shinshuensis]
MELRHLRTFSAVAASSSVTAAAQMLHFAQSTVSEHVSALEKTLGTKLFDRSPRGLVLTDEGAALLGIAHRMLSLADEARRRIDGTSGVPRLRVGALETLGTFFLPRVLSRFTSAHPDVEVSILRRDNRGLLFEGLNAGVLDLGLTFGRPPAHLGLSTERIGADELVVVVPATHRLADSGAVALDALESEVFLVTPEGCGFREMYESALGGRAAATGVVDSVGTIASVVASGLGCALLPTIAVDELFRAGRVRTLRVLDQDFTCAIHASWATNEQEGDEHEARHADHFRRLLAAGLDAAPTSASTEREAPERTHQSSARRWAAESGSPAASG